MPRNRQCNFMMSNYTVYDNGAKSVAIKTLGYERRVYTVYDNGAKSVAIKTLGYERRV